MDWKQLWDIASTPDNVPIVGLIPLLAFYCYLAWKQDNSGFFYTRYPRKGEVPEGQEVYYRHVFYHALGANAGPS